MKLGKVIRYNILLTPSLNGGFDMKIGCEHLSFTDPADMLAFLGDYTKDPDYWEKQYTELMDGKDIVHREIPDRAAREAEDAGAGEGRGFAEPTRERQ